MIPKESQSSGVPFTPPAEFGEAVEGPASSEVKPSRRPNETHLRRRAEIFLRLREVSKDHSASEIAELTDTNYETVRRHLADATAPSAPFLSGLCDALGISAEWLLCGRGEVYRQGPQAPPSASVRDKLDAVGNATTEIERHLAKLADDVR